ncbi:MAG: ArsR family transcriptional regulator [Methylobacter sp.]|nr:MAG: ArsR family transcriptional regulator [Methylobacter sp.]
MNPQQDTITSYRRLYILKTLKVSSDYRMSDMLLQAALNKIGLGVSMSVLRGDLAWLERQGLVATSKVGEMTMALLRKEGLDVADGLAIVPGIDRPQPEEAAATKVELTLL